MLGISYVLGSYLEPLSQNLRRRAGVMLPVWSFPGFYRKPNAERIWRDAAH
jgi:hypothetical protein